MPSDIEYGSDITADEEEHDFLRERELYKYYQPSSPAPSSGDDEARHVQPPTQKDLVPTSGALSVNDAVLGSIVLLTAKLLAAQRSLILLADQHQEYLVSDSDRINTWFTHPESTPTATVETPRTEKRPHVRGGMFHATYARRKPADSGDRSGKNRNLGRMLEIPDVQNDNRVQNDPWLKEWSSVHYYAGIPLRTPNGIMIGLLCVLHDKPRPDMSNLDRETFSRMGDAVVQYLTLVRRERDMQKGRRMELALSRFIASTFSPDRVDLGINNDGSLKIENATEEIDRIEHSRVTAGKERERVRKKKRRGRRQRVQIDASPFPPQEMNNGAQSSSSSDGDIDPEPPFEHAQKVLRIDTSQTSPSAYYGLPFPERRNSSSSSHSGSRTDSPQFSDDAPAPTFDTSFLAHPTQDTLFQPPEEDELSPSPVEKPADVPTISSARSLPSSSVDASHRKLFARASALMHHAIQADGVVFLKPDLEGVSDINSPWGKSTPGLISSNAKDSEDARSARPKEIRRLSGILGYSSNPIKRIGSDMSSENLDVVKALGFDTSQLDERFVRHLTDSWPHGRIFSYSKHHKQAAISIPVRHHTESPVEEEPVERLTRSREVERLRKFLPGSRQIVVVPLYDFIGNVFAVGFAWSSSKIRVFNGTVEGRFMSAFGNSLMAEVSRLHTISAEVAKSNFISSISHELRSPLHGIMASSELLIETNLDIFQRGLVGTIQNCGRTLLDTVNHILTFSRLNKHDRKSILAERTLEDKVLAHAGGREDITQDEKIDVAQLVEEVTEAVHAGYEFRSSQKRGPVRAMSEYGKENKEGVIVVIEIDSLRNGWHFSSPPGALRTLLLNLCGNAIAFTEGGWVKIHLSSARISQPDGLPKKYAAVLTVLDSGRGIDKEYLKSSLFTPFSQEQPMDKGVGLGMSICRQIVEELEGTIEVRSQKHSGTRVTVQLPLQYIGHPDPVQRERDDELFQAKKLLKGKRVCIAGFEPEYFRDMEPALLDGLHILRSSVEKTMSDLLGMTVVRKSFRDTTLDDVDLAMVLNGPGFEDHVGSLAAKRSIPMLGLCRNVTTPGQFPPEKPPVDDVHIDFLPEPYGPRKLARAVLDVFKVVEQEQDRQEQMATTAQKLDVAEPATKKKEKAEKDEEEKEKKKEEEIEKDVGEDEEGAGERGESPESGLSPYNTPPENVQFNANGGESSHSPSGASVNLEGPLTESFTQLEVHSSRKPSTTMSEQSTPPPERIGESVPATATPQSEENEPKPELASTAAKSDSPLSILIVEDNHVNMMLLVTFAKKHKYEFTRAVNGLEALKAVENRPEGFDAILMDIQMPVMSGTESTRAIRSLEQDRKLDATSRSLIIALTGLSADADRLEASRAGVDLYMVKPIALKRLEETLKNRIVERDRLKLAA